MGAVSSPPTILSRLSGFVDETAKAFTHGYQNVKNGDFGKMDWKQGLAMGATLVIGYVIAKSLFEMLMEFLNDNKIIMGLIAAALALVAIFSLLGGSGKQQRQEQDVRPDPGMRSGNKRIGMLDDGIADDGLGANVKKLAMQQVDSTRMALLDAEVASGFDFNNVKLAADHLPKRADELDVTEQARRAQSMLG